MAGGIAGSTHSALTVGDCVNYAAVTASGFAGGSVGGIVGQAARPIVAVQCLNKAAVKFAGESPKVRTAVGGIIGNAFAKGDAKWAVAVVECHNEGDVSCGYAANTYNSARGIHVGGLCGFIAGNETVNAVVRFSSNTGAVHSESGRIGGIMALASFCDVQECVNEGTVDGSAAVAGGISGLFEAGDMYDCVNGRRCAPQRKRQCRRYRGYDADPKTVYSHHRLPQRRRDLRPLRLHGIDIGRESQRHRQGGRLRCRRAPSVRRRRGVRLRV